MEHKQITKTPDDFANLDEYLNHIRLQEKEAQLYDDDSDIGNECILGYSDYNSDEESDFIVLNENGTSNMQQTDEELWNENALNYFLSIRQIVMQSEKRQIKLVDESKVQNWLNGKGSISKNTIFEGRSRRKLKTYLSNVPPSMAATIDLNAVEIGIILELICRQLAPNFFTSDLGITSDSTLLSEKMVLDEKSEDEEEKEFEDDLDEDRITQGLAQLSVSDDNQLNIENVPEGLESINLTSKELFWWVQWTFCALTALDDVMACQEEIRYALRRIAVGLKALQDQPGRGWWGRLNVKDENGRTALDSTAKCCLVVIKKFFGSA